MGRIRTILCATDFSPASSAALKTAQELAAALRAQLLVAHVVIPVMAMAGVYPPYTALDALERAARAKARAELDGLVRAARKRGLRAAAALTDGFAADGILRLARSKRAGLVVMGTHGRTGLSRVVMGSVALRVVSGAPCPVVTVRGAGRRAARRA
jgi:nucleotide-binding universal stress UspA family protein